MEYQFKQTETSAGNLKKYSKLLSLVFPKSNKFSITFLEWQYSKNPIGKVVGFDAYLDNLLVAHYVTIPVEYSIFGKPTKGLLSLNTATHPNHQGKGLFTKLANLTYELAQELGYGFVIGVANKNSTPGFVNKLGFQLVSSLEAKIGLGSLSIPNDIEYQVKSIWNEESMGWRLRNPNQKFYSKDKIIFAPTGKYKIYAVMGQLKLRIKLRNKFRPLIKLWIGLNNFPNTSGVFLPIPKIFRPSPLNLIFKDLSHSIPNLNKKDIRFELLDFDAY